MTWPKIVTKLAEIDLDDHAPKFKELGFDSMEAFDTSDKGALEKIADEIGLKPGHKTKFVKKFYEQTEAAPPTTPPTAIPIAPPAYTVVSLHKAELSTRTGISLVSTANDKLKVESVGEGGVAHGLVAPGDVIIQINDMPAPKDHNEATGMLKALTGDIKLTVHKQGVAVIADPGTEERTGMWIPYTAAIVIVHALTWVCSGIFGLLVYLNLNDSSLNVNDDSKLMALFNFVLHLLIAGAAVAHALLMESGEWMYELGMYEPVVTALALGVVDLALVFSAATLCMSTFAADTYMLAALSSLFAAVGSGMAKIFYNVSSRTGPSVAPKSDV